jgi:hypothetical protein
MAIINLGYILKQDVTRFLSAATLDEMTGGKKAIGSTPAVSGNDYIWQQLRSSAIEMVKGYIRHWYDADTETRTIYEHNNTDEFIKGWRVAGAEDGDGIRKIYVCILDAPVGTALTNETYFAEGDDRNEIILELAVVLLIYKLFTRRNPRQLPEQRLNDYENAIKTLKDIQSGKIQLDIAERSEVDPDDPGHNIAYGDFEDVTHDEY